MEKGTRYLLWSALGAVNTANVYRPLAHNGAASLPAFTSGWLTSEMPLQTIAWQALATGLHARKGALRSRAGKLALGLNLASWAVLVAMHREAIKAGEVLERALVDELGANYRDRVVDLLPVPPDTPLTKLELALPRRGSRRRYATARNLSYGEYGRRNQLDVWRRADLDPNGKAPVLLQVHGGAWVMGSKQGQAYPLMAHMAEQGWVCVAVNYRLSPRSSWPDHIVDVKRAIGWIKEHIAEHGGDPGFVAVTGGSAGGHLSSLAGLTANDPAFQPGFEEVDTTLQAAVPFYGVYDFTNRDENGRADMLEFLESQVMKSTLADNRELWEQASPMHRVHADAPPFFFVHGDNDVLAPVEPARTIAELLRKESNNPVVYAELPRAQHAFDVFNSVRTHATVRAVEWFLAVVYSDWLRANQRVS